MSRKNRSVIIKMVLLMTMLIAMLVLCGCRTRITNNDEVSSVVYDEEGYLQDTYQMRRDELSLSKAKKPLFTGFGSPEDDEYDSYENYSDAQILEEYDPDEYADDFTDAEEVEEPDGSSSGGGSSSPGSGNRVVRRRTSGGSTSDKSTIEVMLEPNGGTCSVESIQVKTGGKYGTLPAATWEDHEFLGWYTKSEGGSKVTKDTKVGATQSHFLFAHWKEGPKKVFTVNFDVNGDGGEIISGSSSVQVEDGSAYGTLPTVKRKGYNFEGWFLAPDGDSNISAEDPVTADHTVYAHWSEKAPYDKWEEDFTETAGSVTEDQKVNCHLFNETDSDRAASLLSDCKIKSSDSYEYGIYFGTKEEAQAKKDAGEISGTILVIPKEAIKSTSSKETVLLYRLMLFDKVYGSYGDDVKKAGEELGLSDYDNIEEI